MTSTSVPATSGLDMLLADLVELRDLVKFLAERVEALESRPPARREPKHLDVKILDWMRARPGERGDVQTAKRDGQTRMYWWAAQ